MYATYPSTLSIAYERREAQESRTDLEPRALQHDSIDLESDLAPLLYEIDHSTSLGERGALSDQESVGPRLGRKDRTLMFG